MGRELVERADTRSRARRHGVSALAVLVLALVAAWFLLPMRANAADDRNNRVVPDGARYYRRATTGTTGTAVAFPGGLSTSSVWVTNEDGSNILYVQFLRHDQAVTSAELAAPVDSTWGEAIPIPAGETMVFDVKQCPGLIWDRASGSGAFYIILID